MFQNPRPFWEKRNPDRRKKKEIEREKNSNNSGHLVPLRPKLIILGYMEADLATARHDDYLNH